MRIVNLVITLLVFILLLAYLNSQNITQAKIDESTDRIIVKFRSQTPKISRESLLKSFNLTISEKLKLNDTYVLKVPKNKALEFASNFQKSPFIEYAEKDELAYALGIPNDPYYSQQWGLEKIQAVGAWDKTSGDGVDIAILDTGVDDTHPDLTGKVIARANFTTDPDADGDGHGTHVAGIASALTNNNLGIAGLGFKARLMSVKVLDNTGSGYYSWISNGIIWASDNGAEVINLSLGGSSSSSTLANAIQYAWNKGVIISAAAGNRGNSLPTYPAYYSQAIAVAATDSNDKKANFSSYGSWVDVASPGVSIISTVLGNGYESWSGTSMSTPFVSSLAALVKSQNLGWSNSQVRSKIEQTTDTISGTGTYFRYGRINACRAVDCMATPSPTPNPTPNPTPTPTSTPTPSPTPTPTPTASLSPSPSPSPSPKPWWCKYLPTHYLCR